MAEIKPFRAWRYNPEKVPDIKAQFSPLFDVVSPDQLKALYEHPFNSIHLSLPRSQEEAAQSLHQWKDQDIIRQDPLPGIYVYYQYFTLFGQRKVYVRKGFIAMIRLEEEEIVLHEDTITHSVAGRVSLLEKIKLNVSPTHGLYRDPSHSLEAIMDTYMEQPMSVYIDYQGVVNKLAIIQNPKDMQPFLEVIAKQKVYLADGHHRLASSFAYRDKLVQRQDLHPQSVVNYHLMYLTNLDADDLRILPTHRVWLPKEAPSISAIREKLETWFELEDVSRSRKSLVDLLEGRSPYTFGMAALGRKWLISLKPEIDPVQAIPLNMPPPLKALNYSVLHYLIFDQCLEVPYDEQKNSAEIHYEKDYSRALDMVNKGEATLAFIASEVSMEQMLEICETGHKMPQKSTYFYPKVVSGLVFGTIDEHETQSTFDTGFAVSPETAASP